MLKNCPRAFAIVMIASVICGSIATTVVVMRPSTQVTRENFFRLALEMTQLEVEEVFREKGEFWHPEGSDFGQLHLCWQGDGIAYLVFDDDKLRSKEWHEDGFTSSTRKVFDRLQSGMNVNEVIAIFGREPDIRFLSCDGERTEGWRDFDGTAMIRYDVQTVKKLYWTEHRDEGIPARRPRPFLHGIRWLSWLDF
jgi:hypothetical protein